MSWQVGSTCLVAKGFYLSASQPNLVPPIITVEAALQYKARLQQLEPRVNFLMSLYLHPEISPDTIIQAKKAGIVGVKSYPAGKASRYWIVMPDLLNARIQGLRQILRLEWLTMRCSLIYLPKWKDKTWFSIYMENVHRRKDRM